MNLTGGKIEQEPYIGQNTLLDVCWRRERKDVWSWLQVYRWLHESHSIGCMLEEGRCWKMELRIVTKEIMDSHGSR